MKPMLDPAGILWGQRPRRWRVRCSAEWSRYDREPGESPLSVIRSR